MLVGSLTPDKKGKVMQARRQKDISHSFFMRKMQGEFMRMWKMIIFVLKNYVNILVCVKKDALWSLFLLLRMKTEHQNMRIRFNTLF